ncbi:metal-dependent hydrolase [Altererythrobacter salegens]|uniref:Metal-dependent hydrolase n=1 Tax=Croceibacterium salegens TaxID=1737568 RepID=A0A6I4SR50_9SPHN|nr:metal-dependent hydrolase [Croceibacterium salegens]
MRDKKFCRENSPERWWHSNDPIATAWYNSVSSSLPRGEQFFVEIVQGYRGQLPEKLEAEARAFVRQEMNHAREHNLFNRQAGQYGYDVDSIGVGIEQMLSLARGQPVEISLAVSIALEHFAASISHKLLTDPRYLEGANPDAAELWKWHAIEELEHKGLVFDVWLWATRDWSNWKRYSTRAMVAARITRKFFRNRVRDALGLLAQDGITGWNARWRLYKFLWLSPGMMARMLFHWAAILMPGFHPWNRDHRTLIQRYDSPYEAAAMPG